MDYHVEFWMIHDKGMNLGKICKIVQINRVVGISKWFSRILMKKVFINLMISYNAIWIVIIQLKKVYGLDCLVHGT
jgi:hypothetical protein